MSTPQDVELHHALQRIGNPRLPNTNIYNITDLTGRGRGFIALQDISKGTRILAEQALFTIENVPRGGRLSNTNRTHIINQVNVNGPHHAAFVELVCPGQGRPSLSKRFQANNFQMDRGTDRLQVQGIFLQASRFNHSCLPNAHFAYNDTTGCLTIHAIENIARGKEILVNYHQRECYRTRAQRHTDLSHYSFTCTCDSCLPDIPFGRSSDGRRAYMATLDGRIVHNENRYGPGDRDQLENDLNDLLRLIPMEGAFYIPLMDNYHRRADFFNEKWQATNSGALDTRKELSRRAMEDARRNLDLEVICMGFDSPDVRETLNWLCGLECRGWA